MQRQFIANYPARMYKQRGSLLYKSTLYTSEDEVPPKFKTSSGKSCNTFVYRDSVQVLCNVTVDLRRLPKASWKSCQNGQYFQAIYDIGLLFGPELVLKFMVEGRVLESANARYTA